MTDDDAAYALTLLSLLRGVVDDKHAPRPEDCVRCYLIEKTDHFLALHQP